MAFVIAGTRSGVGKTTLTMGILAALSRKKQVQAYKVGPDYIDPAFHTQITGRPCRNLDSYLMERETIEYLYQKNLDGADMAVIEGVMGLYDGKEIGSEAGTTASIAKMLKLPVILVVDGSRIAGSLGAVVKGYQMMDQDLDLHGVIINNVGSSYHYELLKESIIYTTGVQVLGYLKKDSDLTLPERHLGLTPVSEHSQLKSFYHGLADLVMDTIDMKAIEELARVDRLQVESMRHRNLPSLQLVFAGKRYDGLKLGIAKDEAFHFYYQDNLDLMENLGVELVYVSPLHDQDLPPNLDGMIIGGGFPEMFGAELEKNMGFKASLLQNLEAGLPYDAECGGLMYMCNQVTDLEGDTYEMLGWFDGEVEMTDRLQHFGYAELELKEACVLGEGGAVIAVHEFHRSIAKIGGKKVFRLSKEKKGMKTKTWTCGYQKANGIGGYAHKHYWCNLSFMKHFLDTCMDYKRGRHG